MTPVVFNIDNSGPAKRQRHAQNAAVQAYQNALANPYMNAAECAATQANAQSAVQQRKPQGWIDDVLQRYSSFVYGLEQRAVRIEQGLEGPLSQHEWDEIAAQVDDWNKRVGMCS